ncbi:MAG: hypothetical protein IJR13_02655 [Bacteroidales bacterium]|nr:hypothetical protein [Bacteroidales bacterium]
MKKTTISLILFSLFVLSCGREKERTVLTYPDGSVMQTERVIVRGDKESLVGEARHYPDGTIQYEKQFDGARSKPKGMWKYYYPNGKIFAKANFDAANATGRDWQFFDMDGKSLFKEQYDSLRVVELSMMQTPATVLLYNGRMMTQYQFYSNCSLRSKGQMIDGKRQGHWVYYHSTGYVQSEADFVDNLENGVQTVYRENGVPYYRGTYSNGKRVGTWEFYDSDGNLTGKKQF